MLFIFNFSCITVSIVCAWILFKGRNKYKNSTLESDKNLDELEEPLTELDKSIKIVEAIDLDIIKKCVECLEKYKIIEKSNTILKTNVNKQIQVFLKLIKQACELKLLNDENTLQELEKACIATNNLLDDLLREIEKEKQRAICVARKELVPRIQLYTEGIEESTRNLKTVNENCDKLEQKIENNKKV